jgi:hypothetical protein
MADGRNSTSPALNQLRILQINNTVLFHLMHSKALFAEIVRANESLPSSLREHADEVEALEEHRFDQSYIEFLDTQIRLNPRGPDWTERLKHRQVALAAFAGVTLLRGRVRIGNSGFTIEIHPEKKVIVHCKEYTLTESGPS